MKTKFKHGDIVRYTGKFLRNTGQAVGVPINGKVVSASVAFTYVLWCDRSDRVAVNPANLELDPRFDFYGHPIPETHKLPPTLPFAKDTARDQVERELQSAGIIEDPDLDGGILG